MELIKDPSKQYVVNLIKPHISYPFKRRSNIEILEEQIEQRPHCGVAEQQSVDDAQRNREHINENVTKWLSSAENEIPEEAKECFVGSCPNLKTRYQLSKKTHKKALAIPKLQIVEPSVCSPEALPSGVLILNQVMDALKDTHLKIIGVYGMGGVGKTTLAKQVHRKAIEGELFDVVVMVAVCQTTRLRRIQAEIADLLGLEFDVEEEEPGRASRLYERLKNSKVLIILDNIWEKLDLRSIGIPFEHESKGCKILLTSMRKDVFWEMGTQKEFSLEVLSREEAWGLFQITMADAKDAELRAIANEVANKCAGLPLLIIIVATYLKDKGLYAWRDTLKQLSDFGDGELHEKVGKVLKSSYENLPSNEVKSFFLLCALFGQSNIPVNILLTYGMGLGLFRNIVSVQDARDRLYQLIEKLKTESLLLEGDMNGYVKMHDLVLHFALSITTNEHGPFFGIRHRLREWPTEDCTRIALLYYDIDELPQGLKYPKAELFSLFSKDFNLRIPDLFFKGFRKLKVLNLTGMRFWSLPTSVKFLTNLHSFYLHGCWLEDVAIIGDLKQLEFLSFSGSRIVELPRQIRQLSRLKLLDLSNCTHLHVFPTNVLSKLSHLEELYMINSFVRWDVEGNASVTELEELCQLIVLEMQIIDVKRIPNRLFSKGLQRYRISVGNGWDWDGTRETSRTLKLKLQKNIDTEHGLNKLLRGIEALYLDEVGGIENRLYDIDGEGCQRLKHLHIGNNDVIQHIIDSTMGVLCCAFPILETLSLDNLKSLEEICHGQLAAGSFSKLQILKISGCLKLKNLFLYSFAKLLPQLQELEVKDCANMEAIIGEGSEEMEFTQLYLLRLINLPRLTSVFSEMVFYPYLTSLYVENCESLKYIFKTSTIKSLLQLQRLKICDCKLMEEIILTKEFEEETIVNEIIFPSLDILHIIKLPNLIRFSSGYPIKFQSLREIEIRECRAFKNFVSNISKRRVIVGNNFDSQSLFNEMVTFSNLHIMEVSDMNNLEYLWDSQLTADSFCKLKLLTIQCCSKLLAVFSSNVFRSFQRLEALNLSYCPKIEEIYQFEGFNSVEVVAFELRQLCITYMPSLKQIWSDYGHGSFTFPNLKSVEAYDCDVLEYIFPESVAFGLPKLESLQIRSCWVEHIVGKPKSVEPDDDEPSYIFDFPELSFLLLENLKEIRSFCAGKHTSVCPKLKYMEVSGYDKDVKLGEEISNREGLHIIAIPQSLLRLQNIAIPNLEKLRIEWDFIEHRLSGDNEPHFLPRLKVIEVVFPFNNSPDINKLVLSEFLAEEIIICALNISKDNHYKTLPLLRKIILSELPYLKHLVHVDDTLTVSVFKNLQVLKVWECNRLRTLVSSLVSFKNLTFLQVSNCDGLITLISTSTAKSLVQLKKIYVGRCKKLQEIVELELYGEEGEIGFSRLEYLVLDDLPCLTSFYSRDNTFNFPCLEEVFVIKCPNMKIFAPVLNTPKLSQVQTGGKEHEWEWEWEDNLNNTIQALFMKWEKGTAINHEFRGRRNPGFLINQEDQKINHMQWIRSQVNPNSETLRLDGKDKVSRTPKRREIQVR